MLRDDLQVALNDLVVALQEAADGHEAAAEHLQAGGPADQLRALAARRSALAEDLGERLRALGDRPSEADSDFETLVDLFAQMKAALSPDDVSSLLEDRAAAEAKVAETARLALEQATLPDDLRPQLEELRADAGRVATELAPPA
jgi:uncharacterized protein (TIGR02284 family)